MLENIMTALDEQNEYHQNSNFVGSRVVYKLFWVVMHWTLQKFIANSYFVKKNIIAIALTIF